MRLFGRFQPAWLIGAGLLVGTVTSAQTPADIPARLLRAEEKSTLNAEGLKPWHLKLAVSLFDDKGQPKEQGTVEEWWNGRTPTSASSRRPPTP